MHRAVGGDWSSARGSATDRRQPLTPPRLLIHRIVGAAIAQPDRQVGNDMPTPDIQRNQWRGAAGATRSTLSGPSSPGAIIGSFAALIDHLLSAQTQLIISYLRIGSSVPRGSRPATPTPTTLPLRPEDELSASVPSDPTPAPATDLIAARAYQFSSSGAASRATRPMTGDEPRPSCAQTLPADLPQRPRPAADGPAGERRRVHGGAGPPRTPVRTNRDSHAAPGRPSTVATRAEN